MDFISYGYIGGERLHMLMPDIALPYQRRFMIFRVQLGAWQILINEFGPFPNLIGFLQGLLSKQLWC